jgi:hypothetical protein
MNGPIAPVAIAEVRATPRSHGPQAKAFSAAACWRSLWSGRAAGGLSSYPGIVSGWRVDYRSRFNFRLPQWVSEGRIKYPLNVTFQPAW